MNEQNEIHVLSISSEQEELLALRSYLSQIAGLILSEASNPDIAMLQLQQHPSDVALVDLGSSELNVEMTKRIRENHPQVRIIILTAADSPQDIFTAMDSGADGYVLKGIFTKALESALRSVRLGAVWLDPGIANQVLQVIESASTGRHKRTLPTGLLTIPLMPAEKNLLHEVASGQCKDGVCMVDPSFIRKLKRFAPAS